MTMLRRPRPYGDPYLTGVALGLVLLAAFVVMGRGLGASGAFNRTAAGLAATASPVRAGASLFFGRYLGDGVPVWLDWLVVEIVGVAIGGAVSAWLAGRWRRDVERGPRLAAGPRLAYAFGGGAVMATGAVLARGCTSGQALTGGALLSVGSWTFIIGAFAAAFLVAPLVRRLWT
jgi:hypothetical protein